MADDASAGHQVKTSSKRRRGTRRQRSPCRQRGKALATGGRRGGRRPPPTGRGGDATVAGNSSVSGKMEAKRSIRRRALAARGERDGRAGEGVPVGGGRMNQAGEGDSLLASSFPKNNKRTLERSEWIVHRFCAMLPCWTECD